MEHRIRIDGRERVLDIRPMDESFIVWRKMFTPPLTAENMETADPEYLAPGRADGRFETFKEFFRKQIRAIGSCAILAWDADGVIGKMRFTTKEMWDAVIQAGGYICVDSAATAPALRKFSDEELDHLLASESRTLRVTCFNVGHCDGRYQGQGIASAMLELLKGWARERRWRSIEMPSCPDVVPEAALGGQVLRRSALERRGFHVCSETRVSAREAAIRRDAIERIHSGKLWPQDHWYMKLGRANIEKVRRLAQDPSWQDVYDLDYLMAFNL